MRALLNFVKTEYNNPEIIVTENGVSDHTGSLQDDFRIRYYSGYINNVHKGKL